MSPLDAVPAQRLENMSEEEFWAYAREQAGGDPVPSSPENARQGQYLECILRQGTCLMPLVAVEEVIPSPPRYTLLPAIPRWVPGLASWRGEVAAVVNLEAYLAGVDTPSTGGLLLCTHYAQLALGLFVPAIGRTITLAGEQITHEPVLDVAALLADVTRQIGTAARYD
jgi:chemotaxis signal transduction protein